MTLTWKSIDPTKVQAYNEDGRLTGIASRGFFETDWDAYLVWNIPRLYLGTWSSEELAKAAIERAAKTTLSGWKSHAETSVAWSKIQRVSSGTCILEFASFPATETCVDPDPAGGEYEVRPVAEAVRAEVQKAIDRGANNKRIAELEAELASIYAALYDGRSVTLADGFAAEEVRRMKRELADARKDSARLDWFLVSEARDFGAFCEWHDLPLQTSRAEASLDEWRAAIDAARRRARARGGAGGAA